VQVEPIEETLEQLAEKAKTGCQQSYEKIVVALQERVFSYVLQLVRNEEDAEDLAQETFVKAYRHIKSFDGRAKFTTWLYSIAKNTAFNHLRRKKPQEPLEYHQDSLVAPKEQQVGDERDSIWTLARQLKPRLFEVLWLHYAEGFSMKEMAEITKSNSVTVRVLLHRARVALRKKCRIYEKEQFVP
jgi:RNA polymerase sigma-70 factor (ECF subfamily)